jgi:hypothetical protein
MLDRLPAETVELLRSAAKTSWIDVQHERHVVNSWVPVLGERAAVEVVCGSVLDTLNSPLFLSVVKGASRMFGANPGSIMKMLPRGWGQIYRDHLTVRLGAVSDERATVYFEDIAREVHEAEGYPTVWKGIFFAIFAIFDCEGEAIWNPDAKGPSGVWTLRWSPIVEE